MIQVKSDKFSSLSDYAPQYLRQGTVQERRCTNICCLVVFSFFLVGCFVLTILSFIYGDPRKLSTPYDPDHMPCGQGDRELYPYIYFVSPTSSTLWRTVCLKSCPTQEKAVGNLPCFENSVVISCAADPSYNDPEQRTIIYETIPYADRICLPKVSKYFSDISDAIKLVSFQDQFKDIETTWLVVLAMTLLALFISFIFIYLLEKNASCIIWTYLIILIPILIMIGVFFIYQYNQLTNTINPQTTQEISTNKQVVSKAQEINQDQNYILVWGILFIIFGIIAGITLFCIRKKIELSIAVIKVSARFIQNSRMAVFIPLATCLISITYFAIWCTTSVFMYSTGDISQQPHTLPFGQFTFNQQMQFASYYHFFALFWILQFLSYSSYFLIVGACVFWYFKWENSKQYDYIYLSVKYYVRYHLGTVALSSFIMGFISFLKTIMYSGNELDSDKNNKILYCTKQCCLCFCNCLQNSLDLISKYSFIYVYLKCEDFFTASKNAVSLIAHNPLRVSLVNDFGQFVSSLGTFSVTIITTFIGSEILKTPYYNKNVNSSLSSLICIFIFSFIISHLTMSILGSSADTILVLYCIDEDVNDGKALHPPKELEEYNETHKKHHQIEIQNEKK